MIPVLGSQANPIGGATAPGQQAVPGLPGLFAELLALVSRPAEAAPEPDAGAEQPAALSAPSGDPIAHPFADAALDDALAGLLDALEALIASAEDGETTPEFAEAEAALQTLADAVAALSPAPPGDRGPTAAADTPDVPAPPDRPETAAAQAFAALAAAFGEKAPAPAGETATPPQVTPAALAPLPRLAGIAARLDALAGRIETVAPSLLEGLETVAAGLRALQSARHGVLSQTALAWRGATTEVPPAPTATPPVPAQSQAAIAPQAPAQAQAQPPTLPAPAVPPEIAARLAAPADADADPARPLGIDRPLLDIRPDAALTARPATPAAAAQPPRIDLPALAVEIIRRFHAGAERFEIRLDPPELGRVDVKLDIDGSRIAARLTVDRPETLDLLQRDARALERALAQAGLSSDRPTLEFALRQNPFDRGTGDRPGDAPNTPARTETADLPAATAEAVYRGILRPGGIDLYA